MTVENSSHGFHVGVRIREGVYSWSTDKLFEDLQSCRDYIIALNKDYERRGVDLIKGEFAPVEVNVKVHSLED